MTVKILFYIYICKKKKKFKGLLVYKGYYLVFDVFGPKLERKMRKEKMLGYILRFLITTKERGSQGKVPRLKQKHTEIRSCLFKKVKDHKLFKQQSSVFYDRMLCHPKEKRQVLLNR